ncbi:unnamed protein product [Periconia digitata]|uniref:GPI inositol-deacylase n=1 Tax=Periconia digitata TaxID=1303443 RepID=A0A9W4UHI0_9PLEO|nr:unnamed protein product [Periconia digitata]
MWRFKRKKSRAQKHAGDIAGASGNSSPSAHSPTTLSPQGAAHPETSSSAILPLRLPSTTTLSPLSSPDAVVTPPSHQKRETSDTSITPISLPQPNQNLTDSQTYEPLGDPIGLTVLYQPEISPSIDIVFVHGLGGTSRTTWSKGKNFDNCWPEKWLPAEVGIQSARILTFGYDANFASVKSTLATGIMNFAKSLLYYMKFGKNEQLEDLNLGQRPIIFIVHSMGGLVVKQAYVLGQHDPNYAEIVKTISAIIFLATPHRGSNLAKILGRILTVSTFNHNPKQYVADLKNGSPLIEALNEQFRHLAPKLDIFSFYETLPTGIGPKKMMIVEQHSATLGHNTEITKSMVADHHTICKYDGVKDVNYISVRSALKSLITSIFPRGHTKRIQSDDNMRSIEALLSVTESYSDDLDFFRTRWTEGTCQWILADASYQSWYEDEETSILWLHARPASGKSILSSFIIDQLLESSFCAYFFFRFGIQSKRSMSTCLRTIAYQIAERIPSFRHELSNLRIPSKSLEKADVRTIWEKVFLDLLFKMRINVTMYWVIDALDESENSQVFVEMMRGVSKASFPIKILLVSRQTSELVQTFERLSRDMRVCYLPIEHTSSDIQICVKKEVQYIHTDDDFKDQIIQRLVNAAQGNFLWASLVLGEVVKCNTEEDLEDTLRGIPSGMENLYERMERMIIEKIPPHQQSLGQMILSWAVCSRRPLLLKELDQALRPEFSIMTELNVIINRVCGQFLVVDASNRLIMVHQTARDHIISTDSKLGVRVPEAHEILFEKCLYVIDEKRLRRDSSHKLLSTKSPDYTEFIRYAMTSWNYHLNLTALDSEVPIKLMADFLRNSSVLAWIAWLANKNLLKVLVYSSRALTKFAARERKRYANIAPFNQPNQDLDLIESWATDLLKLIGRFGPNLVANPDAIYHQIPPFCPANSAISRHFGQKGSQTLPVMVSGVSKENWDDRLAKLSIGSGSQALLVACAGDHIAVADGKGQIVLYNAATFEVKRVLKHAGIVCAMAFSASSKFLATYGFATTHVWSVNTGQIRQRIINPRGSTALTMVFTEGDTKLMAGCSDRLLRFAALSEPEPDWVVLHPNLLKDDTVLDRPVSKVPWRIAFNDDANYVAVAYRDFPMSVWSLDDDNPKLIGRAMRSREYAGNAWTVVDQVIWHPDSDEVLGLYLGGHVFRWDPFQNTQQEIQADATILASSPDSQFFATGDRNGTIKIFDFSQFVLVYQLSCEHLINGICFSPDGKRLYDIRQHFCNVWEPTTLVQASGRNEQDIETESEVLSVSTLTVTENFEELRDQITAIGVQFNGHYQAIGNEIGLVSIVDTASPDCHATAVWQAPVKLPIGHLDWSEDGNYLACSELTGRVVVKKLQLAPKTMWTVTHHFAVKLTVDSEGIQGILLNKNGSLLMIKNGPNVTIWSPGDGSRLATEIIALSAPNTKWTKHPKDANLLLAFSPSGLSVHRFEDLAMVAHYDMEHPQVHSIGQDAEADEEQTGELKVESLHVASDGLSCLVDLIHTTAKSETRLTVLCEIPQLSSPIMASGPAVPHDIQVEIERPLAILQKQRLIYLDKGNWICSYRLHSKSTTSKAQQHYFLPKDWMDIECLKHCALIADGKLLMPHNGELAVIECNEMNFW